MLIGAIRRRWRFPASPANMSFATSPDRPTRTLASIPLAIGDVSASVTAPAEVTGGEVFEVAWTGPENRQDYITITAAGAAPDDYGPYQYTNRETRVRSAGASSPKRRG